MDGTAAGDLAATDLAHAAAHNVEGYGKPGSRWPGWARRS